MPKWCGFFVWFLPWAPLPCPSPSFLGCFFGDLSALYILHYMIHYECPIGFTAYRFLTLAAAWVSDPTLGDLHHVQFASRSRMYVWQRSVTIVAKLARGSAPAPQAHVFECFCVAKIFRP